MRSDNITYEVLLDAMYYHIAFQPAVMLTPRDVEDMMKESMKMKDFDHPNVLNLIGVSIDAGESPHIVMPYMANGSLLSFLKKERPNLTVAEGAGDEMVSPLPVTELLYLMLLATCI